MHMIWSTIMPRLVWKVMQDPRQIDQAKKGVNREVSRVEKRGSWGPQEMLSSQGLEIWMGQTWGTTARGYMEVGCMVRLHTFVIRT